MDGHVVFFGENSGAFAALDARSGEPLWHCAGQPGVERLAHDLLVGARQYVAIASKLGFRSFTLQVHAAAEPEAFVGYRSDYQAALAAAVSLRQSEPAHERPARPLPGPPTGFVRGLQPDRRRVVRLWLQ
ncbi:MAG: hypothetical protein OXF93_15560 [Acidobacteria bacterium]|nr:hypothetical protein [Acidobacteriota bacterium]